jgi:hypothetical protein
MKRSLGGRIPRVERSVLPVPRGSTQGAIGGSGRTRKELWSKCGVRSAEYLIMQNHVENSHLPSYLLIYSGCLIDARTELIEHHSIIESNNNHAVRNCAKHSQVLLTEFVGYILHLLLSSKLYGKLESPIALVLFPGIGFTHCICSNICSVNLGSDHPSIIEGIDSLSRHLA